MHEAARLSATDRVGYRLGGDGGGERQIASGQCLTDAHDVWLHTRMFPSEELAGTPEARRDLIKDQQHLVLLAQGTCPHQVGGRIEIHASGTLHDRLQDQRGDLVSLLLQQILQRTDRLLLPRFGELHGRLWQEVLHRQTSRKQAVHTSDRIANRHGMPCIAMIPAADRRKTMFLRLPLRLPILNGHLHRYLYRHRAAIGIEDLIHRGRQQGQQLRTQLHGRFMGKAPEHDVAHLLQLRLGRRIEHGVIIPMHRCPPGRHPINQLCAICQGDRHALGLRYRINRQRINRRGVGMPQVIPIKLQ